MPYTALRYIFRKGGMIWDTAAADWGSMLNVCLDQKTLDAGADNLSASLPHMHNTLLPK